MQSFGSRTLLVCVLAIGHASFLPAAQPVRAKHAMVVAQEPLAADVGLRILQSGGNAVDAAVAVGFALAVTHPSAGNLGGGGFLLVREADGKTAFLDFREQAPGRATRDMYIGPDGNATRDSVYGWRSSGVPGSVAGFDAIHKKYGSRSWKELLAPAIHLARDGFIVTAPFAASLENGQPLQMDPESKRIFLRNGDFYKAGETFKQPELADTLERISDSGAKGFYQGKTAQLLASEMAKHGGLITESDLKQYKVEERAPLKGAYKGFNILTAPPPSAGGVGLLQMMGMLEGTGYEKAGANAVTPVHYEAEAMRRFYADRSEYLADPGFYNVPVRALLDPKYIAFRRSTIDPEHATPSDLIGPGLPQSLNAGVVWRESSETTHYNVVDQQGNAVAVTYTLNNTFGNGITVPGLGFLLNDEMDDFVAKPGTPNMFGMVGGDANAIEPGKRPLSAMTPTIITQNGKLFMVVGAPGGSRITTGVLEVILDVLDFHMDPQSAVDLPRFHEQWKPDFLYLEPNFPKDTATGLEKMGYILKPTDSVARVEAIVVQDGILQGGTQTRFHGKAAGY